MRKLLTVGAALFVLSLAGCDLYYGAENQNRCDFWGTCDQDEGFGPVAPGGACTENLQCAAGCYCAVEAGESSGECVETGFCERDRDCPGEYECDDRATCIPINDECRDGFCPNGCLEAGCPSGSYCDAATNECVPTNGCITEDDCGPGFDCAPDGSCVPTQCQTDDDCLEGCYCDNGECVETGFCERDEDCVAECDANGENCTQMECDDLRNTCVPGDPTPPGPVASCNGELTCSDGAPECAAGDTPAILDGCYTGECMEVGTCNGDPLALCEDLPDYENCDPRPDCWTQYIGTNCTCDVDGTPVPCDCANPPPGSAGCICATWNFYCRSN